MFGSNVVSHPLLVGAAILENILAFQNQTKMESLTSGVKWSGSVQNAGAYRKLNPNLKQFTALFRNQHKTPDNPQTPSLFTPPLEFPCFSDSATLIEISKNATRQPINQQKKPSNFHIYLIKIPQSVNNLKLIGPVTLSFLAADRTLAINSSFCFVLSSVRGLVFESVTRASNI